ncbi:MAG: hypothetical protein JWO06_1864 [Bacteroidota bacterium]|nr:hypothetical protein [Bacteroidota bacterium]
MVVRWNNRRLNYAVLDKIHPKFFETEKGKKFWQRVKSTFPGFSEFNARLDYIEVTTGTAFRKFLNDNHRYPEPKELKKILDVLLRHAQEAPKPTLFQFIDSFIEEAEKNKIHRETGRKIAKGTIQVYRQTLRRLKEFEPHYGKAIDFDTVDLHFYDRWIEFIGSGLQLSNNTVGKYTKTLKTFLNEATERGLNTNLAFKHRRFKVMREAVHKIYLNERELVEMYNLDLSENKRLERVRDLFIVGCWTALRYGDLVNIGPENITGDKISIKTQKTGEVVVLPLHWMVRSIMKKYSAFPNSMPPSICNVKFNQYLKEIAFLCPSLGERVLSNLTRGGELVTLSKAKWECVTVHTARRSFATNLYLEGISSLTIMKCTAHKSEKVFLSYLKASAEENANLLQNHWSKKEALAAAGVSPATQEVLPQLANNLN